VKYAPRKVYIKENGSYVELSYMEFCRRRNADQTYMDKLFIPIQGCLLEVVREQYTDFYQATLPFCSREISCFVYSGAPTGL